MVNIRYWNRYTYVLLLLYVLYDSRGIFFTSGGIISKSLIAILIAVNLFIIIIYFPMFLNKSIFKPHLFMLFFYLISWMLSDKEVFGRIGEAIGSRATLESLKSFLYANTTFYLFYFLTRKKSLTTNKLIFFAILLMIFNYINMIRNRATLMNMLDYEAQGMQMATGYVFTALIIYSLLIDNIKYRIIYIVPLLVFTMLSAKRGAIILALILTFCILYQTYITQSKRLKISNVIILIAILCIASIFVVNFISSDEFLMNRLHKTLEGDSSNRQDMYPILLSIIGSTDSLIDLFIGRGPAQSVNLLGNYAHNDWFEAMIDFGIFFTVAMIVFYYRMFKVSVSVSINDKNIIRLCLIFLLFKSLVSMGIFSLESYIVMALIGYAYGNHQNKINETHIIINR